MCTTGLHSEGSAELRHKIADLPSNGYRLARRSMNGLRAVSAFSRVTVQRVYRIITKPHRGWPHLKERHRSEVLRSKLLAVYGPWQREGDVKNLIAFKLKDLTPLLGGLATTSRDFH